MDGFFAARLVKIKKIERFDMELNKQKNYQQAFDLACALLKEKDLKERAEKAGAGYEKDREGEKVLISFFSELYTIHSPHMEFSCPGKKTVSLVVRVLLLHHLLHADGNPVTGKWVAYKDIPGGLLYAGVFARRVTEPLVKKYGKSAKSFREAGTRFAGEMAGVRRCIFLPSGFPPGAASIRSLGGR